MSTSNTNDRELLELAAKAVGHVGAEYGELSGGVPVLYIPGLGVWDPLGDVDEAKRLAATLHIPYGLDSRFRALGQCAYATYPTGAHSCNSFMLNVEEAGGEDLALCRAITTAAAEIEIRRTAPAGG